MHVISPKKLRDFWSEKKESKNVLDNWRRILQKAEWQNLAELRLVFPSVDVVGNCIIFDVGKNKYRVVTKIFFREQTILIRYVLTHKEYDENAWKTDCGFKTKTGRK
jgi:mRNA interferase HigB